MEKDLKEYHGNFLSQTLISLNAFDWLTYVVFFKALFIVFSFLLCCGRK